MPYINHTLCSFLFIYELIKASSSSMKPVRCCCCCCCLNAFFVHNVSLYTFISNHEHQKNIIYTFTCMILAIAIFFCALFCYCYSSCVLCICTRKNKFFVCFFPFFPLFQCKRKKKLFVH